MHGPRVWSGDLNLTCPRSFHSITCWWLKKNLNSPRWLMECGWGGATHCPLLGPQPRALLVPSPRRDRWERRRQREGRGGRYLQLCRGRSPSPAVGWPHLCNSPLRSPGWQGRTGRRQVLGCWPPGSLRAARGWSLPGKRARQNSVEHCSYSGLVCRE